MSDPELQAFLKNIGSEWNRLVPNGTMEIKTDPWSGHIVNIYLSIHAHDGITNRYPHIHIFLETRKKPHSYYGFTVSCASDVHFLNKPLSASISPTEYCFYFQELLKTRCQFGEGVSEEEKRKLHRAKQHAIAILAMVLALASALALAFAILLFVHWKIRPIPLLKLAFR